MGAGKPNGAAMAVGLGGVAALIGSFLPWVKADPALEGGPK